MKTTKRLIHHRRKSRFVHRPDCTDPDSRKSRRSLITASDHEPAAPLSLARPKSTLSLRSPDQICERCSCIPWAEPSNLSFKRSFLIPESTSVLRDSTSLVCRFLARFLLMHGDTPTPYALVWRFRDGSRKSYACLFKSDLDGSYIRCITLKDYRESWPPLIVLTRHTLGKLEPRSKTCALGNWVLSR
jgi:hypothetical protein